ncbi:MAG TPA: hypothetical protein VGR76_05010, partial [Candidatus Angelobacter sp.]|nr:hypothetical protein [Candidatus Angelobacter sp.]
MKRTPMPMACERCGSLYFHEAEFAQYRGGLYSSGAGGEISQLTELPQRIWICICGEPVSDPSIRRTGADARSFNQCVAQAKAHRARQQPAALLKELLAELAGKQELAEAEERLANIELALQVIA